MVARGHRETEILEAPIDSSRRWPIEQPHGFLRIQSRRVPFVVWPQGPRSLPLVMDGLWTGGIVGEYPPLSPPDGSINFSHLGLHRLKPPCTSIGPRFLPLWKAVNSLLTPRRRRRDTFLASTVLLPVATILRALLWPKLAVLEI